MDYICEQDGLRHKTVECFVCGAEVDIQDNDTVCINDDTFVCSKGCKQDYQEQQKMENGEEADELTPEDEPELMDFEECDFT